MSIETPKHDSDEIIDNLPNEAISFGKWIANCSIVLLLTIINPITYIIGSLVAGLVALIATGIWRFFINPIGLMNSDVAQCAKVAYICVAVIMYWVTLYYDACDIDNDITTKCKQFLEHWNLIYDKKEREIESKSEKLNRYKAELTTTEQKVRRLIASSAPFKDSASMAADVELAVFGENADCLRHKRTPARTAADTIMRMRKEVLSIKLSYKEMLYKYEFLLQSFPEIAEFIDNDGDLIEMADSCSYSELEESRDRAKDYLSDSEWTSLSSTEKNQLALNRYKEGRKKSKWAIGRDYEMSCAWQLTNWGYQVNRFGIKMRLNDLGRDLIAQRTTIGGRTSILIIQCKYWGTDHVIHENVIMQLFGTKVAYELEHKDNNRSSNEVRAVLMVPSFTNISDVALEFARQLDVTIERLDMTDYPCIKCNINGAQKIYHLPFDQQYDRTEICKKGEFYAYTVKEAEENGFRRAHRHSYKS